MTRKVGFSKKIADELAALKSRAEQSGMGGEFRHALIAIWNALRERPLPPDESETVFGEIRYHTKHPPRHSICVGAMRPLAVQFAVSEETKTHTGELIVAVTITRVTLMTS
jgi:hypothetical protein